jgi:hypothetical protein
VTRSQPGRRLRDFNGLRGTTHGLCRRTISDHSCDSRPQIWTCQRLYAYASFLIFAQAPMLPPRSHSRRCTFDCCVDIKPVARIERHQDSAARVTDETESRLASWWRCEDGRERDPGSYTVAICFYFDRHSGEVFRKALWGQSNVRLCK